MCSIPFLAHLRGGRCYHTSSGTCTTAGNHEYNVCPFLPLCPVGEQLKGGRGASFHTVILCISLLSLFLLRFGNFVLPLQFCAEVVACPWRLTDSCSLISPLSLQEQACCDCFTHYARLPTSIRWSFMCLQICSCHSFHFPQFSFIFFIFF